MKQRVSLLSSILVVAALALAGCANGTAAQQASENGNQTNSISVVGEGQAVGQPDQATVSLGYVARSTSISEAIETSNEVLRQVTEAVQEEGVAAEDVQTTNFSVFTEEDRDPESGLPSGERSYRVSNTIRVVVREVDNVGAVIEAALDSGANTVHGLQYGLSDAADLALEARSQAVNNAQERAEQLAGELGLSLGEVLEINEMRSGSVQPVEQAEFARGAGAPPLSQGTLSVHAQVEITFALVPGN